MAQEQTKAPAVPAAPATNQLAMIKRDTCDVVAERVRQFQESRTLHLPANYSADNAIKSAWLILQTVEDRNHNPALLVCTKDSIANSLLDMIVQGLNPAKKQGYFIVYGNKLSFQRSYFGTMALALQVDDTIDEIVSEVVYEGDAFKYKINRGRKEIIDHQQSLENVDNKKIKAAYCIVFNKDGSVKKTEIMTFEEIKQAWKQSKMNPIDDNGNIKDGGTHSKFTADMAQKTVVNRACKPIINSSSDGYLFKAAAARSEEIAVDAEVQEEIAEHANGEMLTIEAATVDVETKADVAAGPEPSY